MATKGGEVVMAGNDFFFDGKIPEESFTCRTTGYEVTVTWLVHLSRGIGRWSWHKLTSQIGVKIERTTDRVVDRPTCLAPINSLATAIAHLFS
ncbi:hypothetical protein IEQ34_012431 [Dendrobium chrysotoxum]|uniref:Uncharacterized protein n=1 Tax=Dendrobium chrysotoxum TaxID=161865 RepID=A0AAV7GVM7_DENCH|nr:hypothetical protein IEQ34_012431 [Dendrobium chrysotoxum]